MVDKVDKKVNNLDKKVETYHTKANKRIDKLADKTTSNKDEILTSNDKLSKKLNRILAEQSAHTLPYRQLDECISYLEKMNKYLQKSLA